MCNDSLSMHFTISNPSDFDIPRTPVKLPAFEKKAVLTQNMYIENVINNLSSISPKHLSFEDRLTRNLLLKKYQDILNDQKYYLYSEPLSPHSGIPSQLPVLLAEYYFLDCQDVENYFSLLSCIPSYLESIGEYETLRAKEHLFMPVYTSQKLEQQCYSIITTDSVKNHSHFLVTSFHERLEGLKARQLLSDTQVSALEAKNKTLLLTNVIPAYEALGQKIHSLSSTSVNQNGLCYFPKGRSYYEQLVKHTTGSSKDIKLMQQLLQNRLKYLYSQLVDCSHLLKQKAPASLDIDFPLDSPEEMLLHLQDEMKNDYPPLPHLAHDIKPSYTIKSVSKNLENYLSPAFYITPPIDRFHDNTIYINHSNIPNQLDLYTTLAHEGYPGHLYQTVYFQSYLQRKTKNAIRNLLNYGGYTEGWALYTEYQSYDFIKHLLKENYKNQPSYYDTLIDLKHYNSELQLCLFCILDIGIHYDGLTYEEVFSMLAEFGFTDEATIQNIYQYIVEEPATYLKYYIGYLEILELKEEYKKEMGTSYQECNFHKTFLELGPMDFDTLKTYFEMSHASLSTKNRQFYLTKKQLAPANC